MTCSIHLLRENLLCLCIPLQHFGVLTQLSTNLLLVTTDIGDAREEKIQALHNLIPMSVLSLDVLLHLT